VEVSREVSVRNASLCFIRINTSRPVPPRSCFAVGNPLSGGHHHERNFSLLCCGMFSLPLDRVTTPTVSYFFIIWRGTEPIFRGTNKQQGPQLHVTSEEDNNLYLGVGCGPMIQPIAWSAQLSSPLALQSHPLSKASVTLVWSRDSAVGIATDYRLEFESR
jgi:hypothetical protein